jgi:predicted DNA-binding transcriptional regulator YafY
LECGDPYYLTVIDGDWFLVGYCHLREVVLMFAPARIRELREAGSLV